MTERLFHVTEKGSTVRTELLAGLTTFMTMAYILVVNSGMFAELSGVSYYAIYIATALSAAKVKVTALSARSQPDGYATVHIVLEVKDRDELSAVINKLNNIQGVYQVLRAGGK